VNYWFYAALVDEWYNFAIALWRHFRIFMTTSVSVFGSWFGTDLNLTITKSAKAKCKISKNKSQCLEAFYIIYADITGRDADHSPPSSAEVKYEKELYLLFPHVPTWHEAGRLFFYADIMAFSGTYTTVFTKQFHFAQITGHKHIWGIMVLKPQRYVTSQ
jgi:hypothetical protein